jgi:16S rRNA (cytosine967-C5)-methyltransferase
VWPRLLAESPLSAEDTRFATELAYASLRRYGQWDAIVRIASGREPEKVQPEVWWLLILGTHQILAMSTPQHAAVNEMVALCKTLGFSRASGLVNAVLRRVSERSLDQWYSALTADLPEGREALAATTAHPVWIVEALARALEREGRADELPQLLAAHNTAATTHLALLGATAHPDDQRTPHSPIGVVSVGNPGADPRVLSGAARVQDEGSQLAALVAAKVAPMEPGMAMLDACAGPGGKTAVWGWAASQVGATLVAVEQHPHRAALVRDSVRGLPTQSVEVIAADVIEWLATRTEPYDRILLDAPCLGLGALRRRPEARWRKTPSDLESLRDIQRSLLLACAQALAPGGHLVYVTCSPVVEETTEAIAWILEQDASLQATQTDAVLERVSRVPLEGVAVGSAVQLWPHRHGTDAMFIQVLTKSHSD